MAAFDGHLDIVQNLIENGENIDDETADANTPLIYATQKGHSEIVELLVKKGANVNATNTVGFIYPEIRVIGTVASVTEGSVSTVFDFFTAQLICCR